MAERADDDSEQRLTLHDVATAGITKAMHRRRRAPPAPLAPLHSILPAAAQASAPQCGGLAAHRDDEEMVAQAGANDDCAAAVPAAQALHDAGAAGFVTADAGGWTAEGDDDDEDEAGFYEDENSDFDWEADQAAGAGLVRRCTPP